MVSAHNRVGVSGFLPTRQAGLERLAAFAPLAGRCYTNGRNSDPGHAAAGAVSRLSPYVRYRLITEREIVAQVLRQHSFADAEKFVQEVLWRTYWKGWLEMRPSVWMRYVEELDRQRQSFRDGRALAAAEGGTTGIDGFDDWARELVETGYLHNHARMWFASIWIFTLRLPWVLGADFFLRHLLDADAASNTLSWRWVAGLQTIGKAYLATAENIARFSEGRFRPVGLATEAIALIEAPVEAARSLPGTASVDVGSPAMLLTTHEDMYSETALPRALRPVHAVVANDPNLLWGKGARALIGTAMADAASRVTAYFGCAAKNIDTLDTATLISAAQAAGARQIVMAYAPVGPVADRLAALAHALADEGIALAQIRRNWDTQFWPYAKRGFFPFKERIPALLLEEGLA